MTSADSSKKPGQKVTTKGDVRHKNKLINWKLAVLLPFWVYASFIFAGLIISGIIQLLSLLGVDFSSVDQVLFSTITQLVIYILAITIVIGVPFLLFKNKTTLKELGLNDLISWMDIGVAVPAYIVYMVVNVFVMMLVTQLPFVDPTQAQQLPFDRELFFAPTQYILIFLTLVVLAPLAEEALFRGYLFGKVRKISPFWLAALIISITFGIAHFWTGPGMPLQWVIAVDTFVLSLALCLLREYTGAIWAGVIVHAIKNGIAYYFLFVNPQPLEQLKAGIIMFL